MPPYESLISRICSSLHHFQADCSEFFKRYTEVTPINGPQSSIAFISAYGTHFWKSLSNDAKQVQVQLVRRWSEVTELLDGVVSKLPTTAKKALRSKIELMQCSIEQSRETFWKSNLDAAVHSTELIHEIIGTITSYFPNETHGTYLIPDTNVFYDHPDISAWNLPQISCFTVVLIPAVLSELDDHKHFHKSPDVRELARRIARQFNEFRRRGSLLQGIAIIKNAMYIQASPLEPRPGGTPSWLDLTIPDDRIIASTLDFSIAHLQDSVLLATSDMNLQTKADLARIPCIDGTLLCVGD